MEWVVDASIFQDMRTHGNTNWIAKELVMSAVLWVWSEKSQLTAAFGEAMVWSQRLLTKLGYYARECNGIVYVGPDSATRKNQPPLVLRLIHLKNERGDVYLLTNVLNSREAWGASQPNQCRAGNSSGAIHSLSLVRSSRGRSRSLDPPSECCHRQLQKTKFKASAIPPPQERRSLSRKTN
jgi:hypothetical protein